MISVQIDKIIPIEEARDKLRKVAEDVQKDSLYIITNEDGRPCAAVINVEYLEELSRRGGKVSMEEELKKQGQNLGMNQGTGAGSIPPQTPPPTRGPAPGIEVTPGEDFPLPPNPLKK
jgi:PHD/YefM family antitoxin component YafN of YafNO toxin-antitoxin module